MLQADTLLVGRFGVNRVVRYAFLQPVMQYTNSPSGSGFAQTGDKRMDHGRKRGDRKKTGKAHGSAKVLKVGFAYRMRVG